MVREVLQTIGALRRTSDRQAGTLLLAGLALVAGHNAVQWREDRALAARLREQLRRPRPGLVRTPRVSLLVAAWNEAALIERHLESVLALRYPDLEFLLCAGGDDATYELARRYERPGLVVLEQRPGEGKQAALRRCFEQATGEIVYLTDADCLLDDDCFERTLGPVLDGEAEAATGGSRPPAERLRRSLLAAQRWAGDRYTAGRAPRESSGLLGRNAALTRAALVRAGGLSESVASGTDYHLAKCLLRAGARIRLVPSSEVITCDEGGLAAYLRRQRRWLRNVLLLGWRFDAHEEVRAARWTSLVGLGVLIGPLFALPLGRGVLALWAAALAQASLSKIRYLTFAIQCGSAPGPGRPVWQALGGLLATLADALAAALALGDYLMPEEAWRW